MEKTSLDHPVPPLHSGLAEAFTPRRRVPVDSPSSIPFEALSPSGNLLHHKVPAMGGGGLWPTWKQRPNIVAAAAADKVAAVAAVRRVPARRHNGQRGRRTREFLPSLPSVGCLR